MNAIIVEDNISISWEYEMILDKLGITVMGVFKNWKDAYILVKRTAPDFAILDIFLDNNENGFDFAKHLNDLFIPYIICTGYPRDENLNKAFLLNSSGFFSKPLDKPAFTFKIKHLIEEIKKNKESDSIYTLKSGQSIFRIPYDHIVWIQTEGNYSTFYISNGKKYILKKSLIKLIHELDSADFLQSHRSCIINPKYILKVDLNNHMLQLSNGQSAPIGNNYKSNLLGKI